MEPNRKVQLPDHTVLTQSDAKSNEIHHIAVGTSHQIQGEVTPLHSLERALDAQMQDDVSQDPQPIPQTKTRQKRRRSFFKRAVVAFVVFFCVCTASLSAYLAYAMRNDFLWLDLAQLPHKDATILYAQNTVTGEWDEYARLEATQQKIWVDLDEIPITLQQAFVAIEDKDFYEHSGVSWTRTVFAGLNEVAHALTGSYLGGDDGMKQGASTINQQLIKNLLRDESTNGIEGYLRKVREIARAVIMDITYDKDAILQAYLNVISFTGNTAGVQAESIKLFNKTVDELSLAQCASIASITKNPAGYNPVTNPEQHLARRNYILYEMYLQGYITQDEYQSASVQDIGLNPGEVPVPETDITTYFTDALLEEVSADLAQAYDLNRAQTTNLLYNGGLRIYTTVDAALQERMEYAFAYGGFFLRTGVKTTVPMYDASGAKVLDEHGRQQYETVLEYPQAAMVSLDYSGGLKAVVGGVGEKEISRGFNRATHAKRQVGSTMKAIGPYVLALERNTITWSSQFLDYPTTEIYDEATDTLTIWPQNVTQTYTEQPISVADAFAQSVNTIAVQVGEQVGIGKIYNFVTKKLGITSFTKEDNDVAPMTLGASTYGVTPYELAAAYQIFGNGGVYHTPHTYHRIETGYGSVILMPDVHTEQVIGTDTAMIMNELLQGVMQGQGTASGYTLNGTMEYGGKTGTSSDHRDFWFAGITPYYVSTVWYGYDSGFSLDSTSGTYAPIRVWQYVMNRVQAEKEPIAFPVDDTVQEYAYCTATGGLAQSGCPSAIGYYKADNVPKPCVVHGAI